MSRQNLAWLLGIVSVSVLGFAVSVGITAREKDKDYEHVRLFVDVLHEVRSRYVYPLTPERERQLVEDMLNGGLAQLDPHSQYLNEQNLELFETHNQGENGGVTAGPGRTGRRRRPPARGPAGGAS